MLVGDGGDGGEVGGCGGCIQFVHGRGRMKTLASLICRDGARRVFTNISPTRQTLLAPSAKRREVFGDSHEG